MTRGHHSLRIALLGGTMAAVSPERRRLGPFVAGGASERTSAGSSGGWNPNRRSNRAWLRRPAPGA
jgi:hypothetical protein